MADLTDKPKDQEEVDLVGLEQLKQESPDVLSEPAFPIVTNLPESQPTAEVVDFPIVTDFPKASPFSDGGLRFSADRAKGVDPVQHAEDVELSRQTGLPVETVSKNRGAIFERMSAPDLDKIEKDSPVLSRGLSNPDFAIFSKKSLPALEAIERRYKAQKERTFTQVTLDDLKRGTVRLGATGEALGYQLDNLISKMGQGFLPKPRHISEEDWERQRLRSIPVGGLLKAREAEEAIPQNPKIEEFTQIVEATQQEKGTASAVWEATKYLATNPTLFAGLLAEQVAPMAATLPLGGPVIGSAVNPVVSRIANEALRKYVATSVKLSAIQGSSVMVQMYGSEINEGLSKGLSVEDALDRAAKKTMVEAGVNMLAGPIPGAGKNPVLLALQETAKQGVLGATGAAAGSAAVGEQISLSEFLLEGFGELTTAPIDLAVASFEMTSSGRQDARRGVDLGPDIVPLEVEEAFESIHAQTELTEMIAMVQSADVTSLSPASMKEYIDELANEYEHNNVLYIDADNPEVADVLNAMEDSPIFGELKKQFAEGGDIVIPLSDYLTEVAISDYGNNLRNHVRITEDGLTLAELQDFSEDTEKKIENVLTRVVKSIDDVVLEEEDQAKLDTFKESVFTSLIATERMDQRIAKANTEVLASRIPTIMADYSLSFDEAVERLGFGGVVASEPPKSGEVVTMAQEQGYEGDDPVEASEWSQAVAKFGPEGMTREARMARAEEQGYKYARKSATGVLSDYGHAMFLKGRDIYAAFDRLDAYSGERYVAKPSEDSMSAAEFKNSLMLAISDNPYINRLFEEATGGDVPIDDFVESFNPDNIVDSADAWDNPEYIEIAFEGVLSPQGKSAVETNDGLVVFGESNIRSINAAFDPDFAASPNLLAQEDQDEINTPEFKNWAGGADVDVVEPYDVNDYSFRANTPVVLKVFHGTTHDFEEFDALRGNLEGQFGAVNYFTSSEQDAYDNYTSDGPDLTNRIDRRAEQLQDEIQEVIDEDGLESAIDQFIPYSDQFVEDATDIAQVMASKELVGGRDQVMELFVRVNNPFVIGENAEWIEFVDDEAVYQDAINQVADNNGITIEEVQENIDEYEDQIDELRWEIETTSDHGLVDAVQAVADRYDVDASSLAAEIYGMGSEASPEQIEQLMRGNEEISYATDPETGDLIGSHLIAEVIEEMGFDSIILRNAEQRFRGMYIPPGTTHVHIFDSEKTKIKSVENVGSFDPESANIYRQKQKKIQAFFLPEKRVIGLTKHSNPSSFVHEVGHLFLEVEKQLAEEFGTTPRQQEMLGWLGVEGFDEISKDQHEQFARGFEAYLYEGKAPSVELASVFARFRAWMITIYKNIRNLDVSLTPEVRDFFDHLLATDEQIARVRNNPEYDQFFMSKEAAGMTEEEWRAHQESRQKSKDKATQTLEEKVLKRLRRFYTKEWKEEEAKVKQEAVDMLLETDLYRASAFIRGDLIIDGQKGQLNKAQGFDLLDLNADPVFADQVVPQVDSLLVAVARLGGLSRELAQREGVDPDNWRGRNSRTINQPVFGKPIFKIDGLDFDAMRERLYDEGYRYESASDLVDAVQLELSGTEVHSVFYDPDFERKKAKPLPRNLWGTTAKNGLDAEEVAARFGFASAYDMLNKIAKAPLLHQRATALAREHMVRKHGDILNDGTIELQAREAAKNEEHAKVLMTAIKALGKKTGTKVNIDRGYLKVQAAKTIGAMGIKEIKPAKFYRAGIRSAERAAVALNEGRDEEALHYKIQHLANHYLYKEAVEAKAAADKRWAFIKKAKKRKYDTKKVSPEYVTQIKGLVAAYEEADTDIDAARESFIKIATWIDKQWSDQADAERPDVTDTTLGEMVAIMQRDDLAGAEKEKALGRIEIKTLDSLTVEELSGVYDMVRNLRYIGGRMSQANAEALTEIVRQAVNSMKAAKIGGKDKSPKATPSPADILGSDIKQVHYDQIALRQLVLEMDGWEYFGPVWNAFFQGIHDSSMDELKLKRETHEKLAEMFGNFGKARLLGLKGPKELKRTWFKTNEDGRRGVVLGNGEEWILSRRDRVMLALYWGSDYARDIILQNSKLPVTEPAVLEQLSFLSEDELNLVEEMWALNESFWPKVEATALAINGVAPPKVPHSPYVVNGREMPGGYMRIFYAEDPKDAKIPDRHNEAHLTMAGAHLAKNTKHGARVERVGSGGRELSLEMDNYFRAIEETIHDVTFAETARDSWRFLQHPEMVSAIYELYGKEHYRSMQGALTGMIAGGALDTDMFSKLLRYLRTNASLAYLGYSPRNFVQQPVAMANVINEIGEKYTAVGLAGFAGTPKEIKALKTLIQEKSEFMRYRPSVVNRETADIKNRLDSSALAGGYQRNAFWLQTKGDAAVAYPAWWGAYQQGLEKFGDEHRAVTYADETVAKTVGSGLLKDLPPLLQGVSEGRFKGRVELVKGFTFMMTFFNLIYQIQNETIKKNNLKTAEGISSATRSFFWVIAVQSLVSAALVLDLPDEGDDEGWAEWAAKSLASFSLSSVVFVRDIVSALTGFGLKTPYTKVVPATVSGAKKAGEILTNEEELSVENAAKLARTMGLMAPLPGSYALARMLEGIDHQERTGQGNIYSIAVEGKPR